MNKLFAFCVLLILSLYYSVSVRAQIRGTNITVTVTPDHKNWTYKTGENIGFTVSVMKSGTLLDDVKVSYEMGPDMYPDTKKEITLRTGTTKITGKMQVPGFYKLRLLHILLVRIIRLIALLQFLQRRFSHRLNVLRTLMSSGQMP